MNIRQIQEEEDSTVEGTLTIKGKKCSVKVKKSGNKFVVEPEDKDKLSDMLGKDDDEKDKKKKPDPNDTAAYDDYNQDMEEDVHSAKYQILEMSSNVSINKRNMMPMRIKKGVKKFMSKETEAEEIKRRNVENMTPMQLKKELTKFYSKDTEADEIKRRNIENMTPMQMKKELTKFYAKKTKKDEKVWESHSPLHCKYCNETYYTEEGLRKHEQECSE